MVSNLTGKICLSIIIAVLLFVPLIFCAVHGRRRPVRQSLEKNCYFVYMSPALFILGVITVSVYFLAVVAIIFTIDANAVVMSVFLAGGLLAECYCYLTVTYEIKCNADSLNIHRPPLPPKKIMLYEITTVRYVENRMGPFSGGQMHLYLYKGRKKVLDVDQNMIGFYRLLEQLAPRRRPEWAILKESGLELGERKEDFSVMETTLGRIRATCGLVFFGGAFIVILWNWEELFSEGVGDFAFLLIFYLAAAIVCLKNFMCKMLRKITISYRTISIRNAFGRTVSYSLGEITKVLEKKHDVEIYVDGKMVVRVGKNNKNYALLAECFRREGLMALENAIL